MVMFPHRKPEAPYFSSQTLLSSCMKPYATNSQGKRVTKAGKEYLQHAASFQVHFLQVTALIKRGLRARLETVPEASPAPEEPSILNSVYNWFMAVPAEPELPPVEQTDTVLSDPDFLKALKRELKLFEVCLRIFEQECIETIIETQKEV